MHHNTDPRQIDRLISDTLIGLSYFATFPDVSTPTLVSANQTLQTFQRLEYPNNFHFQLKPPPATLNVSRSFRDAADTTWKRVDRCF